ncbi:MAG: phosphoribosyltransferase family protein [Reichenbachiella sp.]
MDYHNANPNPISHDLFNAHKVSSAYAFIKYNKEGIAQKLLYKLKYAQNRKVGEFLGRMMAHDMQYFVKGNHIDLIIPVPIHKSKKKRRGYNQTEVLAEAISGVLNIEIRASLVARNESKQSQAKKGKLKRWANIEKQYYIKDDTASLAGRNILVLDDVITTGATVTVLINLLAQMNPARIYVACVATGK